MHHKTQPTNELPARVKVYIGLLVWVEGWHPLPYQERFCVFTIDPSIVRAVPVSTKTPYVAQFSSDQKMSEREVTLFFNLYGTLFSDIF